MNEGPASCVLWIIAPGYNGTTTGIEYPNKNGMLSRVDRLSRNIPCSLQCVHSLDDGNRTQDPRSNLDLWLIGTDKSGVFVTLVLQNLQRPLLSGGWGNQPRCCSLVPDGGCSFAPVRSFFCVCCGSSSRAATGHGLRIVVDNLLIHYNKRTSQ